MTSLTFSKKPIDCAKLCDEIQVAIGKKLYRSADGELIDGDYHYIEPNLVLDFNDDLTAGEITKVNTAVTDHTP